jgi:hypothetical protein
MRSAAMMGSALPPPRGPSNMKMAPHDRPGRADSASRAGQTPPVGSARKTLASTTLGPSPLSRSGSGRPLHDEARTRPAKVLAAREGVRRCAFWQNAQATPESNIA